MTGEEYLHLTDEDLSINSNYYIHSCTGEKGLIVSSDDKGVILYNKDRGTKFNMSIEILNKFWTPITEDEYKEGTSYPIKITMELDDRAFVYPPDYVNPIIADFHKYDNE